MICNRAKCKSAWRTGFGFGRYATLKNVKSIQEVPINKGPKVGVSDDRASSWRVIAAGTPISANQYHCATVGAAEAIAAADRANAAHWARSGRRPDVSGAADQFRNWHPMREYCLRHARLLQPREHQFVAGLSNWHGDLTGKQRNWLAAIHSRLQRQTS
jgi:hypothetical protein